MGQQLILAEDLKFVLNPRCPVCRAAPLFKRHSITVVDTCAKCGAKLGDHDIGDGASVFLIFLFGFLLIPMAWAFERAFHPPLWVHPVLWGSVALGLMAFLLPRIKAYIILLEWRHKN